MKIETAITITLTKEELNAVKLVHNMLAGLPPRDIEDLDNALPSSISIYNAQESLALIYELATDGDTSGLIR